MRKLLALMIALMMFTAVGCEQVNEQNNQQYDEQVISQEEDQSVDEDGCRQVPYQTFMMIGKVPMFQTHYRTECDN